MSPWMLIAIVLYALGMRLMVDFFEVLDFHGAFPSCDPRHRRVALVISVLSWPFLALFVMIGHEYMKRKRRRG